MLFKHYKDLIGVSYQRMIPVYSNFADALALEIGFQALEDFYGKNLFYEGVHYKLYGGFPDAERKLFCFLNGEQGFPVEEEQFPICCIRFSPVNKKFGEDLSHRDYLGTIMGLGITREQIGDILVQKDSTFRASLAYVFCKDTQKELLKEITRIRHTTVKAEEIDFKDTGWTPEFKETFGTVSSLRLDAVVSLALKASRSQVLSMIRDGNVTVSGRICTENAKKLEEQTVFSVRGYGKFIFDQAGARTKKGRYQIKIKQYV